MAVIDTITIGADSFSVYALTLTFAVAETTTFFNGRLGAEATAWAAAVTAGVDDEKRALAAAADWMDRALNFTGDETAPPQARAWPRDSATNGCTGDAVTDGTTPDDIFYAQAWLAGAILVDNAAAASSGEGSNVKSAKAGSAQVVFFRPTEGSSSDTRLPKVADDFTKCYTDAGASSGIAGPSITGTAQTGTCADGDELAEGFA
tara:strand:+ start:21457 stop:22071 length:615 start_codon:yes stop_codon:yes gene_type:complete